MSQFTRRSWLSLAAAAFPAGVFVAPAWAQSVRRPAVVNGRRYLQYDVFTDQPLAGNQWAVFTETAGLTAAQMQLAGREDGPPEPHSHQDRSGRRRDLAASRPA